MKKFIIKASLFVLPFLALFSLNMFFYNKQEGDLVRLGYLYTNPCPKSLVIRQYDLPKHYTLLSELDLATKSKFDILIIGDSFSEQGSLGYKNFLANKGVSVLHVDRFISGDNPVQTLIELLNSKLFDCINADYIVLQSIERSFNQRNKSIDFHKTMTKDTLSKIIKTYKKKIPDYNLKFFSDATLKAPLINIQYLFKPKPYFSKTYRYKSTSNNLFSNSPDELLFYQGDIKNLDIKNDSMSIFQSIKVIEKINELVEMRNIKLIALISPDKYDLYYQFIKNNESLKKPLFFEIYEQSEKKYINVNSYQLLNQRLSSEKDIYFYDDSHWSPKGAKIIADEIYNIITE